MNFSTQPALNRPPTFVLDVSVAVTWGTPRRSTPYSHRVRLRLALGVAAVVATNWPLALTEELLMVESQGRTNRQRSDTLLASLASYRIYLDERAPHLAWPEVLDLARVHNLPVRDAASLELSLRLNLPLATADAALGRAAGAAGVPIFTP